MSLRFSGFRTGPRLLATRSDVLAWWSLRRSLITYNGTNIISGVSDLSANAIALSQSSAAIQPAYNATGLNGRPSAQASTSGKALVSASFTLAQPFTIITVAKVTDTAFATSTNQWLHTSVTGTAGLFQNYNGLSEPDSYSGTALNAPAGSRVKLASPCVVLCVFNGASSVVRVLGAEATGNAGTTGLVNGLSLGGNSGAGQPWIGQWGECAILSSALSLSERVAAENDFRAEWGI